MTPQAIEVAKVSEFPPGTMRAVDVAGFELLLVNADGRLFAMSRRCGHMNASLADGVLKGNVVTCAFHSARFDVATAGKVGDAVLVRPAGADQAPPELAAYLAKAGKLTAGIKTHDCQKFDVVVEGDIIKVVI
ncbi:MAG: Rieske (2Fe-2S) protein [Verrucomicrobiaceae bacterium]|nr:Rieske (2Fe-2S) protein [Verrucomicrobiaceae bacterium]